MLSPPSLNTKLHRSLTAQGEIPGIVPSHLSTCILPTEMKRAQTIKRTQCTHDGNQARHLGLTLSNEARLLPLKRHWLVFSSDSPTPEKIWSLKESVVTEEKVK